MITSLLRKFFINKKVKNVLNGKMTKKTIRKRKKKVTKDMLFGKNINK